MKVNRIWSNLDRALITFCSFLLGLLLGAFLQASVRDYFWILVIAVLLIAFKPAYSYFRYRERRRGAEAAIQSQENRRS